jgi:hypothetical protein
VGWIGWNTQFQIFSHTISLNYERVIGRTISIRQAA